jgi:small-conductance mechanosensitive channel
MVKLFGLWDVPTPGYIDDQYWLFIYLLIVWLIIGLSVVLVVRPVVRRLTSRTETDIDDRILKIIDTPIVVFIFFYGFVQSLNVLESMPDWLHHDILRVYGFVVAVFIIYIVYKVFKAVFMPLGMEFAKKSDTQLDDVLIPLLDKFGGVLIIVFGAFYLLSTLGINITVFLAGAGIIGIVLAFALQSTLGDFFSGIFLLLDRPIKAGDLIDDEGDYLRVEHIGLRSTRFYNIFKHDLVIYPNHHVADMKLVNLTEPDKRFKISITVNVAYGSPMDKVERILLESVAAQKGVSQDPARAPVVRFEDFGESALKFTVYLWVDDIMDQWRIAHDARRMMEARFKSEGIEIPFPQRVVHIQSDAESAKAMARALERPAPKA